MGTKISHEIDDGGEGLHNRIDLIGYCKESPIEVLKEVFQTHVIKNYRGLYRPIDWNFPANVQGLHIEESRGPKGTRIIGTLENLDLAIDNADLFEHPRTRETYERALASAIHWHLESLKGNYLYATIEKNERKDGIISRLREVASVTLGIEELTIGNLREIFEKHQRQ